MKLIRQYFADAGAKCSIANVGQPVTLQIDFYTDKRTCTCSAVYHRLTIVNILKHSLHV